MLIGIGMSTGLVILGIALGGEGFRFFDLPSLAIVVGGTVGATLLNYSTKDLSGALRDLAEVSREGSGSSIGRMRYLVDLCHAVRTQGRLQVLEAEGTRVQDTFLKFALEMAEDGQSPDEVRRILETEMRVASGRAARSVQVFETMGAYSPALGLIGTVIGLIQMLGSLSNPAAVGPAMATALVTTFYGAVASNLFLLPVAGKLRNRAEEQHLTKALTVEGMISVIREENPMLLEQRLQSFNTAVSHEETGWRR